MQDHGALVGLVGIVVTYFAALALILALALALAFGVTQSTVILFVDTQQLLEWSSGGVRAFQSNTQSAGFAVAFGLWRLRGDGVIGISGEQVNPSFEKSTRSRLPSLTHFQWFPFP